MSGYETQGVGKYGISAVVALISVKTLIHGEVIYLDEGAEIWIAVFLYQWENACLRT